MHSSTILAPAVALLAMVQFCPAPEIIPAIVEGAIGGGVSAGTAAATVGGLVGSAATASVGIINAQGGLKKRQDGFEVRRKRSSPDLSGLGLGTAWPDCKNELTSSNLVFNQPDSTTVTVDGMPQACMDLATVITGKFDAGNPVPEGSSSIKFTGLTSSDLTTIKNALDARNS